MSEAAPVPPIPPEPPGPLAGAPKKLTAREQRELEATHMKEFVGSLAPYTPRIYVTYILLAMCVGLWLLQLVRGVHPMTPLISDLQKWGADYGPLTTHGQWWRTVTSMFLHIGAIHLAMNMLVLVSIGRFMERLLGNLNFLVVYLFAGVAGSFLSLATHPTITSAGASGALFGLYGALAGFLLRAHGTLPPQVLKQLWRMAGTFLLYNLLYGVGKQGIDMAAHIGGLGGGFVAGLVVGHPLDAAGFAGRGKRAVVLALVGVVGFAALALRMPKYTDAWVDEIDAMDRVEKQAIETFNDAFKKVQAQELSDGGFADILEHKVLPPWRAETEKLRALSNLDTSREEIRQRLLPYFDRRAEGWQMIVDGVHKDDEKLVGDGFKKEKEADELLKKLSGS